MPSGSRPNPSGTRSIFLESSIQTRNWNMQVGGSKTCRTKLGAWHDELALSRLARNTFSKAPRERHEAKLIFGLREQEIAMAETAQKYLRSVRDTDEYQRLRRLLSAAVFAMEDGQTDESPAREPITGLLH